jgi:hypothetical protein
MIHSDSGHLVVMPSEHKGVKDIVVGGPGFEFPLLEWDGKTYRSSRTVAGSELPAPINP